LTEVEATQTELRQWRRQYPEDTGILEGGEVLSHRADFLKEGCADLPLPERQQVMLQAMDARTRPAIRVARQALQEWAVRNPDEARQDSLLDDLLALLDVVEEHCGAETRELQTVG